MPHPYQPCIGVRAPTPQAFRRGKHAVSDNVVACVDIDGDKLSMMVRLDKMADIPVVYLVPEATRLIGGPARWRGHLSAATLQITFFYS